MRSGQVAKRSCGIVINRVTGCESISGSASRAGRQLSSGATAHVYSELRSRCNIGRNNLVFQAILLLGPVDLAQVIDAGVLLGLSARSHEVGDGNGGQQTNDGDHDHDFHQGETCLTICFNLHIITFQLTHGVNAAEDRFIISAIMFTNCLLHTV